MKHIRKYNEGTSNGLDNNYLKLIFAEFIDKGAKVSFDTFYWRIIISIQRVNIVKDSNEYLVDGVDELIGRCIDLHDSLSDEYKDMRSCVDKVKDEFPKIVTHIRINSFAEREEIDLVFASEKLFGST